MDSLRKYIRQIINENFNVTNNTLEITEPYDKIQVIEISGRPVYVLFGNVDYYNNRESILAIKRKSEELKLDHKAYKMFLQEFQMRFNSIPELSSSEVIVSVETTSPVTEEMASVIDKPFIKNGFKKLDPSFKMRSLQIADRDKISDLFHLDVDLTGTNVVCVMDDFITSGSTFKNAFDKLPADMKAVGVCLFKLNS